MRKLNQLGSGTVLIMALVVTVLLLIGSLIFGFSAYSGQQDYKNNFDQKLAQQVQVAVINNSKEKDKQFAEQLKTPLKTYVGPADYGAVTIKYPRSWSAYVDEGNSGGLPIDGYFHPVVVPGTQSDTNFALRVQVTTGKYDDELNQLSNGVEAGTLKAKAYRAQKVPKVLGTMLTGQLENDKTGIMVMFPLRDKTLKIWTYSPEHIADFNKYILPNLTFTP